MESSRILETRSGKKALAKFDCILPQGEPFREDLRVLQPDYKPLRDFPRKLASFLTCPWAAGDEVQLRLELPDRLPQTFSHRRIILKLSP